MYAHVTIINKLLILLLLLLLLLYIDSLVKIWKLFLKTAGEKNGASTGRGEIAISTAPPIPWS